MKVLGAKSAFWKVIEGAFIFVFCSLFVYQCQHGFRAARDRAKRTGCHWALRSWKKAMETYASENKGKFPMQLNEHTASDLDAILVNSLSKYNNVTGVLKECRRTYFTSVMPSAFTITGVAKDRDATVMTATLNEMTWP